MSIYNKDPIELAGDEAVKQLLRSGGALHMKTPKTKEVLQGDSHQITEEEFRKYQTEIVIASQWPKKRLVLVSIPYSGDTYFEIRQKDKIKTVTVPFSRFSLAVAEYNKI